MAEIVRPVGSGYGMVSYDDASVSEVLRQLIADTSLDEVRLVLDTIAEEESAAAGG